MTLEFKMVNGWAEVNTDGMLSKHTEGKAEKEKNPQ